MHLSRKIALAGLAAAMVATPTLAQAASQGLSSTAPELQLLASPLDSLLLPLGGELLPSMAFDSRDLDAVVKPTAAQLAAAKRLGASVSWNRTGTARVIEVADGFLSAPSSQEPVALARGWLADHADVVGLSRADVAALEVVRDHELPGIHAQVVSFAQTFDGVASGYGAVLTVVIDRQGRVVRYAGDPVRASSLLGDFSLTAAQALQRTVRGLSPELASFVATATGEVQGGYQVFKAGGGLVSTSWVRPIAFPTAQGARAAYATLVVRSMDEADAIIVDAETGRALLRRSLVQHSEGTIYENYPGAKKGGKPKVVSFDATAHSPGGYVDPTGAAGVPGPTTIGNNANAAIAWTVPLVAVDQYNRPVSPTSEFNYEFTDQWGSTNGGTASFTADANAAAINLFYHHNRIHDEYYDFGFTETGGNFQLVNDTGAGSVAVGGDPIMGGAQSGALNLTAEVISLGRNNANMLTLPDGIPGFTNMYLWEFVDDAFEAPARDGDFDATIIQHEYSHGLSNRYVGGGGLSSLGGEQSGAMGEGWGDWFAMNDLFRRGLSRTAVTAPYVGDPMRGIRNWNYATSPATYGDYGYDMSGPEVHSDGEIWTATLWTLRSRILKAVGGNQRKASDIAEHVVMDGMPLSPQAPSMLDMRDAIIKATEMRYPQYVDLVWSAFAERGFGASAKTESADDTDPVPAFDVKDARQNGTLSLRVTNASAGGPVKDVRVLGGEFDGRATPIFTTGAQGTGKASFAAGTYTLTLQAHGFGSQRVTVTVPRGGSVSRSIALRPNLLSESAGATVVSVSSESEFLPAQFAFDDTEATAWRTEEIDTPYNDGKDATAVVKLARTSTIDTVHVSTVKPVGMPRFAAAKQVTVQTSMDGKTWRTAQVANFSFKQPRPSIADLKMQRFRIKPVTANFVRVIPNKIFGDAAEFGNTAIVAEVQAFGRAAGIVPKQPKPDAPVTTQGSVAVGNAAQGSLLSLDPYRPGVTELSWTGQCGDVPAGNGVDAWFTKLPEGSGDGLHAVTYEGDLVFGEWLAYAYDKDCKPLTGGFATFGTTTPIPAGAAYVGFLLLYGGGASFDVTVSEPR